MRARDGDEETRPSIGRGRARRGWLCTSTVVLAAGMAGMAGMVAGPAAAAGVGYGGMPPVPTAVPGGFRDVVTAVGVTRAGGTVAVRLAGARVRLTIPPGAAPRGEQIVVTRARDAAIGPRDLARVPAHDRSARTIFACGVVLDRGGAPVVDRRFLVLRIASRRFRRAADYVVVYSERAHAFVPAPRGHARVVDGNAVIRLRAGTQVAVIARS